MSSAANPNPNNLLMLAVIGIGAYWFMTRRAMAQPVQGRQSQQAGNTAGMLNAGINALGQIFRGSGSGGSGGYISSGIYSPSATPQQVRAAAAAADADTNPDLNGSPLDWGNDGLAINPVFSSAYDYSQEFWY